MLAGPMAMTSMPSVSDRLPCATSCSRPAVCLRAAITFLMSCPRSTASSRGQTQRYTRVVRTTVASPAARPDIDLAAMLALPPVPLHPGWRNRIRLGRDYYVRVDTTDYSVDPHAIGRIVDVSADLHRVRVRLEGRLVADHARCWARGGVVTDPVHVAAAAGLRAAFKAPRPIDGVHDLGRDLLDYDRAFGLPEVM